MTILRQIRCDFSRDIDKKRSESIQTHQLDCCVEVLSQMSYHFDLSTSLLVCYLQYCADFFDQRAIFGS